MAVLHYNARRLRRKILSKPVYSLTAFFIFAFILLLSYFNHSLSALVETPNLPLFTTTVDDPAINWANLAYAQYVTSPEELCKALMLFSELKEAYSLGLRVLLYPSTWSITAVDKADPNLRISQIARLLRLAVDEFSVVLNPIDILQEENPNHAIWMDSRLKFLAFNLTQYNRVITLGSDSIVLNSLDELFFLPPGPLAMPYVYWGKGAGWHLSNQLMLIQPSSAEFGKIEKAVRTASSDGLDMDIIDRLYYDTLVKLPQRPYHILSEEFRRKDHSNYLGTPKEKWNIISIFRETKLVHFSDREVPTPWMDDKEIWRNHVPRCIPTPNRRIQDCRNRDAWRRLYIEYSNRRNNICGKSFGPQSQEVLPKARTGAGEQRQHGSG